MTVSDKISDVINNYVRYNGSSTVMTRDELFNLVKATYPMQSNSFIASDYCYNRTNEGLNFEEQVHLFEYLKYDSYRILGEKYEYSGTVYYRKRGQKEDSIYGCWTNGVFTLVDHTSEAEQLRLDDLVSSLSSALKKFSVTVETHDLSADIFANAAQICRINVLPETYKLSTGISGWQDKTSYLCLTESGNCAYYIETIDECIGEAERLVCFSQQAPKVIRERILDAADNVSYSTIYEAINDVAGTEYTGWMQGTWNNPKSNGTFRLWFPKLAQIKDGKPVVPSSKCINTISADWNELVYEDLNKRGSDPLIDEVPFYDLIFAKEPNGKYIFRGVYICDREKSRANYYISKRLATRVKLIGTPANKIVLLDEVVISTPTISTVKEIVANCELIDRYLNSDKEEEKKFALGLVKRGTCFLAVNHNGEYRFYPSRFIGYLNNSMDKHNSNKQKDGRVTNPVVSKVLGTGAPEPNMILNHKYIEFCCQIGLDAKEFGTFGVEHKFWEITV